jgi:CheY-like chemotaxis protein
MPGVNGIETCRQLRALAAESGRTWPVWLMSAAASGEAWRMAAEAGAAGFFSKPFPDDLLAQLAAGFSSLPPATEVPSTLVTPSAVA